MPVVISILLIAAVAYLVYRVSGKPRGPVVPAPAPDENPVQDAKNDVQTKL